MTSVTLTPDMERFAAAAVAKGRYRDVSEVVQASMTMLQQAEAELAAFVASLDEARAEGERDGFFTIEEAEARMDAVIDAAERRRA